MKGSKLSKNRFKVITKKEKGNIVTDGLTDWPTDGPTDEVTYRIVLHATKNDYGPRDTLFYYLVLRASFFD